MKRQVQSPGVRKWFGDDWLNIQDELMAVLEGFFGGYNQQFILSGCEVSGNDISAGIVGLIDGSGFHLCRFAGVQETAWPVYFNPEKVIENRVYLDLQVKPVAETWKVASGNVDGGGYFEFKKDGTSARFTDAIQTANRRFVTDAEKADYANQAITAISALRNGVSGDFDTLAKIATAIGTLAPKTSPALIGTPTAPTAATATSNTQIATTAFVKAVVASLGLGDISAALAAKLNTNFDNIVDLGAAITALGLTDVVRDNDGRLTDDRSPSDSSVTLTKLAAMLKAKVALSGAQINWLSGAEFTKNMTANTTFTDSNLYAGKVIVIHLTGNYSPSFPAYWDVMKGSREYSGYVKNKIVAHCINADAGTQEVEYFISQKDS